MESKYEIKFHWVGGTTWGASSDKKISLHAFPGVCAAIEDSFKKFGWSTTRHGRVWNLEAPREVTDEKVLQIVRVARAALRPKDVAFNWYERPTPAGAEPEKLKAEPRAVVTIPASIKKPRLSKTEISMLSCSRMRDRLKGAERRQRDKELLWWLEAQAAKIPLPFVDILDALHGKVK